MKKRGKVLIYSIACVLSIIYIARVYYVNAQTHLTKEYYDIGNQVKVDGYEVSIEEVKAYDVETFFHTYPELRDEYYMDIAMPSSRTKYILVCTMTAVCDAVDTQYYEFTSNYISIANKIDRADWFLSQALSGRNLVCDEDDQGAVSVKLVYIINTFGLLEKTIEDLGNLELRVTVSSYPVEKNISIGTVSEHLVEAEE